MASGAILTTVADFICQMFLEEHKKYNKKRGVVLATYGGAEMGVESRLWFPLLDRVLGSSMTFVSAVKKLVLDQFLYSPIETISMMKWTNFFEGRTEKFQDKISDDYFLALLGVYLIWIPSSFLSFYMIPLKFRGLFVGMVDLVSDTFMAYASHNNLNQRFKAYFNISNDSS